jgi:hypothetical protein
MAKAVDRLRWYQLFIVVLIIGGLFSAPVIFGLGFLIPAAITHTLLIIAAAFFGLGFILLGGWSENRKSDTEEYDDNDVWVPLFILFCLSFHVLTLGIHTTNLPGHWPIAFEALGWVMFTTSIALACFHTHTKHRKKK